MADKSPELYDGMSLGQLMRKVVTGRNSHADRIEELIDQVTGYLNEHNVVILLPLLKDLISTSIKNDESLVKIAAIGQRMQKVAPSNNEWMKAFSPEDLHMLGMGEEEAIDPIIDEFEDRIAVHQREENKDEE